METPLEAVRDENTCDMLFYKKPHPPFKTAHLPADSPKITSADPLPSKYVQVTISNFQKAAAFKQVQLDFGDDYGFRKHYQYLKEKVPSTIYQKEGRSKRLGEVAIVSGPQAIIEDIKNLSRDIYTLSSEQEMLDMFMQENLL